MSDVRTQYEAYPYPARDPEEERRRLITGSPSHPLEIDHFIYGGQRDWSRPLRALIAGGGTGDGLIQLAQMMTQAGKPYEITYVDLSSASRAVAEARAKVRGLSGITFVTGSLLDAPDLGEFDYIDCCGVLHHLPEPAEGFSALRTALAPDGGMGFMVYAPYGRSGVYPLQEAFGALFDGLDPEDRLRRAQALLKELPQGHPFKVNPNLGDHKDSDAGFYDLLLHSQDRAFAVPDLLGVLGQTGWSLSGFTMPALYDLSRIAEVPEGMEEPAQWAIAEKLRGTIKTHVGYAVCSGQRPATGKSRSLVPHLTGVQPRALAQALAQGQSPKLGFAGIEARLDLPREAAPLIAQIDGRRPLSAIAQAAGMDPIRMGALWPRIERDLAGWGMLRFSGILA
jgi:SAM-dependent methyltransferase